MPVVIAGYVAKLRARLLGREGFLSTRLENLGLSKFGLRCALVEAYTSGLLGEITFVKEVAKPQRSGEQATKC